MKIGRVEKLVANLNYKEEYAIRLTNLKQDIKSQISFKKGS